MTPERLREWIPGRLHAELASVGPVENAILTARPEALAYHAWPIGILAAIEEREVAPWLGVSCFLRAGPKAAIRRRGLRQRHGLASGRHSARRAQPAVWGPTR